MNFSRKVKIYYVEVQPTQRDKEITNFHLEHPIPLPFKTNLHIMHIQRTFWETMLGLSQHLKSTEYKTIQAQLVYKPNNHIKWTAYESKYIYKIELILNFDKGTLYNNWITILNELFKMIRLVSTLVSVLVIVSIKHCEHFPLCAFSTFLFYSPCFNVSRWCWKWFRIEVLLLVLLFSMLLCTTLDFTWIFTDEGYLKVVERIWTEQISARKAVKYSK